MVGRGLPAPPAFCSRGTAVTSPGCNGLSPALQRGYEPHGRARAVSSRGAGPRQPLALALPVPELVRAAAPGSAGRAEHSGHRAGGPVGRWGWDRHWDAGTGTAPHPVYKHWREEPHSQGHVGSSHSRTKPSCQRAPESPMPPPPGNCPTGRDIPKLRGHKGSGRAPDPAGSRTAPQIRALRREPSTGTRVPPHRVSPLHQRGQAAVPAARRDARVSELETRSRCCGAGRSHACPPLPRGPCNLQHGGPQCQGGGAAGAPMGRLQGSPCAPLPSGSIVLGGSV